MSGIEPIKKERWVANRESVCEKEFEESRRCLVNQYTSFVQNHVGYVVAIVIGLLALSANFESLLKGGLLAQVLLIGFILGGLILLGLTLLRVQYWTTYTSTSIFISFDDALRFFNEYMVKRESKGLNYYYEKAPSTAILQIGGTQQIKNIPEKSLLLRLALKLHI